MEERLETLCPLDIWLNLENCSDSQKRLVSFIGYDLPILVQSLQKMVYENENGKVVVNINKDVALCTVQCMQEMLRKMNRLLKKEK